MSRPDTDTPSFNQRLRRHIRTHWPAMVTAWLAIGAAAWHWQLFDLNVDDSWLAVMHTSLVRNWAFGRQILFTHGPLGFLIDKHWHPATFGLIIAWRLILTLAIWWSTWRMIADRSRHPIQRLGLNWMLIILAQLFVEPMIFNFAILHAWFYTDRRKHVGFMSLMTLGLSVVCLIKFTYMLMAMMTIGVITAHGLTHRRPWPWPMPLWLAGMLITWLALGQSLLDLPAYLADSWQLAHGYAYAMQHVGPISQPILFATTAGLLLIWLGLLNRLTRHGPSNWLILGLAGLLFVQFRYAFTRQDFAHTVNAAGLLLFTAIWICLIIPMAGVRHHRWDLIVRAVIILLAVATTWWPLQAGTGHSLPWYIARKAWWSFAGWTCWPEKFSAAEHRRWHAAYRANLQAIAADLPTVPAEQTVDVIPNLALAALATAGQYAPRPIFQAYAAHGKPFIQANDQYLQSDRGPGWILVHHQPWVDQHYPTVDDPAAWLTLATHYQPVTPTPEDWQLLQRRRRPLQRSFGPPRKLEMHFFKPVNLKDSRHPIWMTIQFQPSLLTRAQGLLFRPPTVDLQVTTADGNVTTWRLPTVHAEHGFLLSPTLDSATSLHGFVDGGHVLNPVVSCRLFTADPQAFAMPIQVTWQSVQLTAPTQDSQPSSRPTSRPVR